MHELSFADTQLSSKRDVATANDSIYRDSRHVRGHARRSDLP